jgi:carbon monoxide dehydrogenase subunit G
VQLDHQFTVNAPVDVVWQALLDPQRVAPCMPGATLTSVDGSSFAGSVKVKLGMISLLYKGTGEFVETDEEARQVKIKAAGKDTRSGTAAADVTVKLSEKDGVTTGSVTTELTITGKPAQFGRGMIAEVGGRILDTFAGNLAKQLGETAEPEPPAAAEKKAEPVAEPLRAVPDPPAAEPIDLVSYAGTPFLKRLVPLVIVVVVLVFLLSRRRRK